MKTRHALLTGVLLLTQAAQTWAQGPPSPVARADTYGVVSWVNVNKSGLDEYDQWLNRLASLGGGIGWYWTDNLKTEIDGAFSTTTEREIYALDFVDGRQVLSEGDFSFSTHHLSIGQQYQFFRNVWFHPHLTGGVDLAWEKSRFDGFVVNTFDPVTRQPIRTVRPDLDSDESELLVRPYAGIGFKAYMSPRSFFRTDMRFILKGGVDEVLMRFGFGVDF